MNKHPRPWTPENHPRGWTPDNAATFYDWENEPLPEGWFIHTPVQPS